MIYALVTIYNPDKSVTDNMLALSAQVDKVYLLDNSNTDNSAQFSPVKNAEYIFLGENLGLSAAFNRVLKEKLFNDDDFIIFFDQDSHISDEHINILCDEFKNLEAKGFSIGCLGPVYFNTSSGKVEIPHQKTKLTEHSYKVKSIITSSMLVRYEELKVIGFWNEDIFLDMADWDLCWRFIAHKKLCCMTDAVTLHHTLGNGEKKIGFLRIYEWHATRSYYQTRDSLYLLKKRYVPFKFRINLLLLITVRPFIHFILFNNKAERITYVKKAFADYFRNKKGSISFYRNEKKDE